MPRRALSKVPGFGEDAVPSLCIARREELPPESARPRTIDACAMTQAGTEKRTHPMPAAREYLTLQSLDLNANKP